MVSGLTLFLAFAPAALAGDRTPGYEKVVVLGFDGADAKIVERLLKEGRLPNLARLRDGGYYAPLRSTNPPQTPVSWSSFTTGINPGRTGIFDFLRRTEGAYYPEFAMIREGKRPLMFGAANTALLGASGAIIGALMVALVLWVSRRGLMIVLTGAAVGALLFGSGLAYAAAYYLPEEVPEATNSRKGLPFWTSAASAGISSRVLNVPATFPAEDHHHLEMLSGLGVPDMRGRIGTPSIFTSDPKLTIPDNQFSVEIIAIENRIGTVSTSIVGPINKPFFEYVVDEAGSRGNSPEERRRMRAEAEKRLEERGVPRRLDVPFSLEITERSVTIDLGGRKETLRTGDWSDWFVVPIPVNPVVDLVAGLTGTVKFKLIARDPEIKLYMSPINFHPECQPVRFTGPRSFATDLLRAFGLYKTLGWPIDTWTLPSGVTDEDLFLEDMRATVAVQRKMMNELLTSGAERLYVQVFDFPDRVGHMLWRLYDRGHPLYDKRLAAMYAGEIDAAYELMDAIVGDAMSLISPGTALIVCSDHGFTSFRRGVNYNTWLVENGFMTLREGHRGGRSLEDLFDKGELGAFFKYVDWSRTKAYAMGLGNIYINLMGREPKGSVVPGREYEEVRDAIVRQLEDLIDPETGERPIRRVYTREEMYSSFDPRTVPDLRAANNHNYRVGWQTALGEVPPLVIEDNLKAWSGDHCSVDPDLVPGILVSNVWLAIKEPWIGDLHPTILALLGASPTEGIDGESLVP